MHRLHKNSFKSSIYNYKSSFMVRKKIEYDTGLSKKYEFLLKNTKFCFLLFNYSKMWSLCLRESYNLKGMNGNLVNCKVENFFSCTNMIKFLFINLKKIPHYSLFILIFLKGITSIYYPFLWNVVTITFHSITIYYAFFVHFCFNIFLQLRYQSYIGLPIYLSVHLRVSW